MPLSALNHECNYHSFRKVRHCKIRTAEGNNGILYFVVNVDKHFLKFLKAESAPLSPLFHVLPTRKDKSFTS